MAQIILIVEDDDLSMKLETDLLHEIGYNVLQSRDGSDALSLARKHDPALIIMDIRLPSVSGIERTMMLKADNALKDIPVLAVTAIALKGEKKRYSKPAVPVTCPNPSPLPIS